MREILSHPRLTSAASLALALTLTVGLTEAEAQSLYSPAGGGSSLPPSDTAVRTDLHDHFERLVSQSGPTTPAGPAWQFTPDLDLAESITDNAYVPGSNGTSWDLITQFTPSVNVVGDSSRVKVNLFYGPSINIYARNSASDSVTQSLNGNAHATLIPETLFLDLQAFAGVQSISGGVSNANVSTQNRQNQSQNYSFSAAPYVQHRFGGFGTAELGYKAAYNSSNGVSNFSNQSVNAGQVSPQILALLQQQAASVNTNVITQNEHASFNSGEDFGRVNVRLLGSATQYSGNGIYAHAHNTFETLDLGYAINRYVAAIGEIGYEDIAYSGIPPFRVKDIIWAAGAKLTLKPEAIVTATYGRRFGRPNLFLDASYPVTTRLRVFARYSQSLTTNLEDIQNTLSQIDVDQNGGVYDRATGAPVAVVDDFAGLQNGVYRLDRGSLNAVLLYSRDTYSFILSREARKVVSAAPGALTLTSSRGTYGTLSWAHLVNAVLTTNLYLQYGKVAQSGFLATNQDSYSFGASLTYALSPTLTARGTYSYNKSASGLGGQDSSQNYLLVGLHKRF